MLQPLGSTERMLSELRGTQFDENHEPRRRSSLRPFSRYMFSMDKQDYTSGLLRLIAND